MRRADPLSNKTTAFVCEDHFNLEQDMENYVKFQIMKEGPSRLRPGVIHTSQIYMPKVSNNSPYITSKAVIPEKETSGYGPRSS
ncbi:hypothetical protein M8J77_010878 [Diaphorina citri]|nr:hypothetical protein M8J77_010878 [Diaphorina citri]